MMHNKGKVFIGKPITQLFAFILKAKFHCDSLRDLDILPSLFVLYVCAILLLVRTFSLSVTVVSDCFVRSLVGRKVRYDFYY